MLSGFFSSNIIDRHNAVANFLDMPAPVLAIAFAIAAAAIVATVVKF